MLKKGSNHRIRIGMFVNLFHPIVGGAERQVQQLASRLIKSEVDVNVITRRQTGYKSFQLIDNIPVYRILSYYDPFRYPLLAFIRRLRQRATRSEKCCTVRKTQGTSVHRQVKEKWKTMFVDEYSHLGIRIPLWRHALFHGYDILHFHLLSTFKMFRVFPWRFKRHHKILKLGAISDFEELRKSGEEDVFRDRINQHFDRLICVSSEIRRRCLAIGIFEEKLSDIPNGVDTDHFVTPSPQVKAAVRKRLGMDEKFMILSVGSQQKVKGLDLLLQAVATLKSRIPNLYYLHLGKESNATANLENIVAEAGLQAWASFPGEVRDVIPYLHAADVFILPSFKEGLSNALLEAMSCGLPVITTDVSGSQDLVRTGDTGVLIPTGDAVSLTRALDLLYTNGNLRTRCGQGARRTIQDGYSMDQVIKKYIELYNSLGEA